MRLLPVAAASLALCALASCTTDAPLCRYWTDEPIGRGVIDPATQPMLPYNPYWVAQGATPAADDPCAGQPGHLSAAK